MAIGMGCKRIVFVGMDLSNGFDHKITYADGTRDEGTGIDSAVFCDISGRGVFGLLRMYFYKAWLEYQSLRQPVKHINATGELSEVN